MFRNLYIWATVSILAAFATRWIGAVILLAGESQPLDYDQSYLRETLYEGLIEGVSTTLLAIGIGLILITGWHHIDHNRKSSSA